MQIEIILETDEYLIINKPAGLMVHADGKRGEPTLADWIIAHYPHIKGVGEPMRFNDEEFDRPGIVHRLDEETSGALIIAKTQEAFEYLKREFMERRIEKEYHAFVWGHFKETAGTVDEPIGRSRGDFRRWLSGRGVRGESREAQTKWEAVRQFADENGKEFSFMHLFPKTGRTHQLRVHMKFLQRPIVSDHLYAKSLPDALGFSRLALHARKIAFFDTNGAKIEVVAPYPADFEASLARYVQP